MGSHWIPPYTRVNGRKQETVCGAWILPCEHSAEPTCPECAAYLQQEADETEGTAAGLDMELVNDSLVPKDV